MIIYEFKPLKRGVAVHRKGFICIARCLFNEIPAGKMLAKYQGIPIDMV